MLLIKSYTQFDLRENISVKLPEDYCEVDFTQISDYEEKLRKDNDPDFLARMFSTVRIQFMMKPATAW